MAMELVYTSATKGIKPGSFGFCTVACSREMNERTILTLEKISGYRRVNSSSAQSPTVYAHLFVEGGGETKRVLSRIGDAGLDYSKRDNKIACHFLLDANDLIEAGPAALFSVPNLFVEKWNEKPKYFERPIVFPRIPVLKTTLDGWKKLAVDPGWAGVLASTAFNARSTILIVDPELDVLRLFQEAIALLPENARWNVTFSTYFTKAAPGVRCQWKAIIKGAPEEAVYRVLPDALLLDLTCPQLLKDPKSRLVNNMTANYVDKARAAASSTSWNDPFVSPTPRYVEHETTRRDEQSPGLETPVVEPALSPEEFERNYKNSLETSIPNIRDENPRRVSKRASTRRRNVSFSVNVDARSQKKDSAKNSLLVGWGLWAGLGFIITAALVLIVLQFTNTDLNGDDDKELARNVKEDLPVENAITFPGKIEAERDPFALSTPKDEEPDDKTARKQKNNRESRVNKKTFDTEERFGEIPEGGLGAKKSSDSAKRRVNQDEDDDFFENDNGYAGKSNGYAKSSKRESYNRETNNEDSYGEDSVTQTNSTCSPDRISDVDLSENVANSRQTSTNTSVLDKRDSQTVRDFIERVDSGELAVDFDVFKEPYETGNLLRQDVRGNVLAQFQEVCKLCKRLDATIEITCDIEEDVEGKRWFLNGRNRRITKKIDFNDDSISAMIFSVETKDHNSPGYLRLEFANSNSEDPLLAFAASDVETRDYFLAAAKFKWEIKFSDEKFAEYEGFASKFNQLLKPTYFKPDTNVNISAFNEMAKTLDESRLALATENLDADSKKNYLYVVQCRSKELPDNVDVTAKRVKNSIDFIFSYKLGAYDKCEFMTLNINKNNNGKLLHCDKFYDPIEVENELTDYFTRKIEREALNSRSNSRPVYGDLEVRVENYVRDARKEIESAVAARYQFEVRIVPTRLNDGSRSNECSTLLGIMSVGRGTEPDGERRKRN